MDSGLARSLSSGGAERRSTNGAVVYPDGLDPAHSSASGARNFRRTSLREKAKLLSRFNKSTRRANHPKTLSSPFRKNISLSPSGKSLI